MGVEPKETLDLPKKSQKHWGFNQETLEFTQETMGVKQDKWDSI
jgi:hypothetical protein